MLDRALIDYQFNNLEDVIYLNTSMVAMPPKCVQEAYHGFFDEAIKTYNEDILDKVWAMIDGARKDISKLIDSEPSEIAFVKNTAEGIGIIATGYPLNRGDKVIISDLEHASSMYAWINAQKRGIDLHVLTSVDGKTAAEDFIRACHESTKIIVVSAVQFSSGYYVDLTKLGEFCKNEGIVLVVDGIQAVGRLNIDVKRMNIDYLACGANKGLLSPCGSGFIYCGKRIVEAVEPPYASYQSVKADAINPALTSNYDALNWHKDARRLESGNLNYGGIATIQAGTKLINQLGIQEIENYILYLEEVLREAISGYALKVDHLAKRERSGIIFIYFPVWAEHKVKDILKSYRIYATVRSGYIRLGINFFNKIEQMYAVADALKEISML